MLNGLTVFGQSSSGIGALGINGQAFIIQLITFLLVFLILKRYAFKPILRVLKRRQDLIDNGVKLGEQMQKEKRELEQSIADKLHKASDEADKIISLAEHDARVRAQETEEKAQAKAKIIIDEADQRIKQEVVQARRRLKGDLVELVSEATEAIIGEKVDTKKDAELIDRSLKEQKTS